MSFSDWTKKRQQQNGAASAAQQTGTRATASSPAANIARDDKPSSFGEWTRKNQGVTAWRDEEVGFNQWLEQMSRFSSKAGSDYQSRVDNYQSADDITKYRDDTYRSMDALSKKGQDYRTYFQAYKSMYDEMYGEETTQKILSALDDGSKYLDSLRGGVDSAYNFWSQFQDEDDYNTYKKGQEYAALADAPDFAEKSRYVSTYQPGTEKFNAFSGTYSNSGFGDIDYDYINRDETARNRQLLSDIQSNASLLGLDNSERGEMTDDEIAIFNYLYAQDTANGDTEHSNAYAYIDYLTKDLNYRQRAKAEEEWAAYANEHPVGSSVFSVLESPLKGVSYLGQFADWTADGKIDQNAGYNKFSYINSAIRNEVNTIVEDKWGGVGSFAYNTGMSMGDFLFSTAVTGGNQALSLAIMGTGAAADTTIAAKDRGLSDGQAFALGTIAGVAEIITEKVSLDALLDKTSLTKSAMGYFLKNTLAEGSEEVGSDFINLFADILIAKDKSAWQQSIDAYQAEGMDESEAFWHAVLDQAETMGLDFLGGALSGGVMSGGGIAINAGINEYSARQSGAEFSAMGEDVLRAIIEEGLASDPSTQSYKLAQQLQQKLANGETITNAELGHLYQANVQAVDTENAGDDLLARAAAEVAQGRTVTNRMASDILGNPGAVDALRRDAGLTLTDGMSRSQRRAAVKSAVASLASRESGTDGAPATSTPTQPVAAQTATQTRSVAQQAHDIRGVQRAASALGKNGAKALTAAYDGSVAADTFYGAFAAYYEAGVSGMDMGKVRSEYSAQLNEAQKYAAYVAGQNDAATSLAREQRAAQYAQVAGTDSGLVFDDYVADILNAATAERVNSVAKLLGLRVRFVDSVRGGTANAQISGSEVLVERNNPNPVMFLLGHEWTHRLQELAPTEYRAFREAVAEEVQGEARDLLEHYRRAGEDISYEDALDEAAANYAGRMIEDSALLDQFIEKHRDNRSMLEKVRDAIRALISKLTGAERRAAQTAEGKLTAALEAAAKQAGTLQAGVDGDTMGATRNSLKEDLENGRARKEERAAFLQRAAGAGYEVYEGKTAAYGYRNVRGRSAQRNARQVQEEVKKLGIDAEIIDGPLLWNRDGITGTREVQQAVTVDRARIFINNAATISPRNIAGHEAFHLWRSGTGRDAYIETVEDNLLFSSEAFREYQSSIAEAYLGGEADLNNDAQMEKLREELFAYISGDIHEGVYDDFLRTMLRDFDAVKAAWNELVALNSGKARYSIKEYSTEEKKDHANAALEFFGRTYSWKETGYLTQSGKKIDFSGKHEGGPGGYRTVDHRDIRDALGEDYGGDDYSGSMVQFMAEGNIRIMPESNGINLAVAPTKAQEQALDDFISRARGEVILDIDAPGGDTVVSMEYPRGTRASKVLADIRQYFEDGTQPYVSEVAKFRYSLKRATSSEIVSAEEMENEGATREDIWAELGVIRDAAGNWVSEIDDTRMKYHRDGDARFTQAHPEYAEYQGLMQKMFYGSLTDEEYERLQRLDEMWGREIGRLSERVDRGNATLEDILEFDELFAAYPQLRNINVRFADLKGTRERASFNQRTNTITLDESLRSSPESTLLHEIQHAIQRLEKRPTGASVEYWQDRMAAGETFREHDAEIAQARRRMDAAWDKMPEDLKNRVREINRESIRAKETGDYDRLTELQEAMFNSEDGDLYAEYDNALWEIRLYSENNTPMSAEDLYYRTAGEIEARLVQQRRRMTAEERRANMPDLGWDRAVFSRNGPRNYSLKGSESSREAAALQEENNLLRERVEYWKGQTRRTKRVTTDKKAVTRAARELIRSYGADLETTDISGELQSLYDYIASGYDGNDELTYTEARRRAEAIAEKLVESAVIVDDDMYQQYSDLRSYLRTTKLTISEEDSHNIADYGDFRKRNMGRMTLTKGNTNIDRVYEEMAELWPEFFDPQRETHPADQLAHIAEVVDGIYDITEHNPFSRYMEQAVADAANEVMEMFFDLPQTRATFADRQARKLDDAKAKGRQQVQKVREEGAARLEELRKQNREKVRQTIEKERQRRETEIGKLKTRYREKDAAGRERRNARELRAKIIRHVNALSQKLLRPSDKQHIPEKLRQATAAALEAINLESAYSVDPATGKRVKDGTGTPTKRTEAFRQLRLAYADITKEGGDYTLIIDPDLMDNLNELEAMKDTPLMEMGTAQLATVWATVKAVEASIRTANRMLGQTRFQTISQFADGIKGDNLTRKDRGDFRGVAGWLDKKTNFDMLTPQGYFHRLGKTGEEMFRMMRSAQDRHIEIMRQAQEATRKITGKADINKLERETHTFDLEGGKLTMSTAQIMALYELMKRQQAQDHILKGGIRPETISSRKGLRESRKADPVRVSLEDIATITGVLTEEQRRMADGLQKFMGGDLAELGNEASMEVYGYRKFNERDYFPIQVDKNQTKRDIAKEAQAATIAGRGFTKSVTPHANNAVMLNSIFDVYASHVNDMATYAAWLPTMENIRRIRDFTFRDEEGNRTGDVKSIIERVFGKNGNPYLNKLVDDINQGIKPSGTGGMNALVGNYKAAAVAANLRVILQQPTAILRALDGISPKYLLAGTVKRGDWEKVMKYAPIARWKDWGYFDINTGRQMKDVLLNSDSALEKVKQASMAPAGKADSFAWARLWNAVEAETKDKRPGLKPGTDAFYRAVADRFSEIVDRTQVVDGLLQRSQIMRSPDALDKMATSFMGEPTKTYNMFVNAVYDLRNAEGKEARTNAKRGLARTTTALVVSFAVNAVMQSVVDALRDDDKERDYWEKLLTAYTGFTGDEESFLDYWNSFWDGNLEANFNPMGYLPYFKDMLSIAQGYDVSRMDMEPISKVWDAAANMKKALSGEGKYSLAGASANLLAEAARLLGIPVANLKRDIQAGITTAAIETDSYLMQYRIDKALLNMGYSGNTSNFMDILYNASINDREAYEIIYADMVASGIREDKIRSAMEARMKRDQGVESVADLEARYLTPKQEQSYNSLRQRVTGTSVWSAASAEQREALEEDLYNLTVANSSGLKLQEKIDGGAAYGIDEADYLLYRLALHVVDQPSESGNLGSYTGDEVQSAIDMLTGLDDEARAYLWEAAGKSEKSNPYK